MKESKTDQPLVSIIVITYNSSKYVLETLDSAYNQTYQNIELIVTDDGSTDNTVEICNKWLATHADRFVRTNLITAPENTGIPANCNRGVKEAKGEWIKLIAGDDLLLKGAISNFMENISFNNYIYFSNVIKFQNDIKNKKFNELLFIDDKILKKVFNYKSSINSQILYFLNKKYIATPGVLFNKIFINLKFDEKNKFIEDIPFFLDALFLNYKIIYLPIVSVAYRKHENNITKHKELILPIYYKELVSNLFKNSIRFKNKKYIFHYLIDSFFVDIIFKFGNKGIICKIFNKGRVMFNPINLKIEN